ncbi:MAG: L7Ae/L30e/S12e/Gadd45 family ribosomal protein [Fastidiosipilaceae bacterium]|nr:50S ribosomal protein L7ae [Clostridiaceae bacterium]
MFSENKKLYGLLGLSRRAGKLILGMDAVLDAIRRRQVTLLILATDAAPGSKRRAETTASKYGVPWCQFGTRQRFGELFSRRACAILALTDAGFAAAVQTALTKDELKTE